MQAYRLKVLQDGGAYPARRVLPLMTRMMRTGVYDIPKVEFNARSVVTNTTPTVAYRGAGRPEATAAIERAIDLFAAEIGMDPAEVRRTNLIAEDAFPYTTPTGTTYDIGDYERRARPGARARPATTSSRAEQARRRAAGEPVQLGIGLSLYVEITAGPQRRHGVRRGRGARPTASAIVYTGARRTGRATSPRWP